MRNKLIATIKSIVLVSILAFCLVGCGEEKELSSYEQGIAALEYQSYGEALQCFKAAENVEGENLKLVYRGEGMALLGLGQYNDSIEAFDLALSQSNGIIKDIDYDINFYIAVAQYKSGKLEDCVATYTNIIAVDKKNSDAYYMRGKVYLDLDKVNDAKNDFDQAIALDKDDSRLYINIYEDLTEHGLEGDAKGYINSGLASVSKPSEYELGIFNYYLGDYTQARNYFEETTETKKTSEGIIYLGKTYEALNDASYAEALYEGFVNDNETGAIVYNELGLLRAYNKDYAGALAAFEAGINSNDTSCRQTLMFNRIVANEFLGDFDAAKRQMEEYISLYPDDKIALRENTFISTR